MMNQKEKVVKAKLRLNINNTLLTVSFTIFALIVTLNPPLLKSSFIIPLQLTLSIPLLLTSIFARSKLAYANKPEMWNEYGFFTFLIGYAFLINVVGILLSISINPKFGLIFLSFNLVMAISYSIFEIIEKKEKLASRIKKDLFFAALLLFGGILPSLGFY